MFGLEFTFYVGLECVWFCQYVPDDDESDDGEGDANDGAHDNVKRMVEVITDPRETHPEAQDRHPELEEGPKNIHKSWVEIGPKVDDEKYPAEETETRVSGEKW